ncbi:MAG: hypothetical protein OXG05_00980 [Gammaproteobacteria bacterium]|nr:hypothetical protein [Gammaproteobacteria bacterium]
MRLKPLILTDPIGGGTALFVLLMLYSEILAFDFLPDFLESVSNGFNTEIVPSDLVIPRMLAIAETAADWVDRQR